MPRRHAAHDRLGESSVRLRQLHRITPIYRYGGGNCVAGVRAAGGSARRRQRRVAVTGRENELRGIQNMRERREVEGRNKAA